MIPKLHTFSMFYIFNTNIFLTFLELPLIVVFCYNNFFPIPPTKWPEKIEEQSYQDILVWFSSSSVSCKDNEHFHKWNKGIYLQRDIYQFIYPGVLRSSSDCTWYLQKVWFYSFSAAEYLCQIHRKFSSAIHLTNTINEVTTRYY